MKKIFVPGKIRNYYPNKLSSVEVLTILICFWVSSSNSDISFFAFGIKSSSTPRNRIANLVEYLFFWLARNFIFRRMFGFSISSLVRVNPRINFLLYLPIASTSNSPILEGFGKYLLCFLLKVRKPFFQKCSIKESTLSFSDMRTITT